MELTILGCSGSLAAPGNPASGYLVTHDENSPALVMDMGPGVLAALQEVQNPSDAHVMFTHLHADHCLDFPSLMVWRRFHPFLNAQRTHKLFGPEHTPVHVGRLSADAPDGVDDMSDSFEFSSLAHKKVMDIDGLHVTAFSVEHPVEAYAFRVEKDGASLCYSGDTCYTDSLIEAASGVDYFLCEAAWGPEDNPSAPGMHMSGRQAGVAAREAGVGTLVLVHLQPWADKQATAAAAAEEFDGPIIVGEAGMVLKIS